MKHPLKLTAILTGALLLAILLGGCGLIGGAPQFSVSPQGYDFGRIGPDEPVTTNFTVSNPGNAPLKIDSVTTSCGCTTAQLSGQTVAPGATVDLDVTFDPQAHDGATGKFVRYVYLRTNDSDQPEVEVKLEVEVVAEAAAQEVSQ